jgi:hypothetical protein
VRFSPGPGVPERDLSWLDLSRVVQLTPDARTLLFMESGEGGGVDYGVFLRGTEDAVPVRVGAGRAMSLSADGRWVLSVPVRRPDRIDLLPTGPGETRVVRDQEIAEYEWAGFHPDGRSLVFSGRTTSGETRMFVRDLGTGPPRAITPAGSSVRRDTLSPDGRHLAAPCGSLQCIYPLDGGAPRTLAGTEERSALAWGTGDVLYLRARKPVPAELHALDLRTGRSQPWRALTPPDPAGVVSIGNIVVTADGRAYAYSYARQLSDLYVVTGLE